MIFRMQSLDERKYACGFVVQPGVEMLRIYLVEDNPIIRENLTETLTELVGSSTVGWSETEQGATAWFATNDDQWDLAIVDLFLKRGSGIAVIAALRQRTSAKKVIVLTNYSTPEVRAECLRLGADKVFDKTKEIDPLIDFCKALAPA
jgi:two-component system OmpR family response regulator